MASSINASITSTGIVQTADATGILQLQTDGTTGLTLNANANVTVSNSLFVSGSSVQPIVLGTAQNTTSGTTVPLTGIPSWAQRVTVLYNGVSTSGSSEVIIQLGTSSGFVTSGYLGGSGTINNANQTGDTVYTSGFILRLGGGASSASVRYGRATFTLFGNNIWIGDFIVAATDVAYSGFGSGSITLPSALTQIRFNTVNGTDTFDAGSVNILYE